jgi:mRNA interferase RelE/StbE
MKVLAQGSFLKDLKSLKRNNDLNRQIEVVINQFRETNTLSEIRSIKHLSSVYYRIRIGDYRLGFRLEEDTIILQRILHRKDIYKLYPPK